MPPAPVIEGEATEVTEVVDVLSRIGLSDMDSSLAVQLSQAEIDQQITTARKYPRSIDRSVKAITELATYDPETAQECIYNLPRGKGADAKVISGPSIRMAELIAQQWGNNRSDARVVHIDRKEKYVEAEGVYHDLETNVAVRVRVRRRISDKYGKIYNDDMIIVTGNAACSIALRNAILRGVPKPVWRSAYDKAQAVVRGDERTLQTRRGQLLDAFEGLGVTNAQVYQLAGVAGPRDIGLDQLVYLAGIFTAIRNNEVTAEDLLQERTAVTPNATKGLQAGFGDDAEGPKPGPKTAAPKASRRAAAAAETPHDPATGEVQDGAALSVVQELTPEVIAAREAQLTAAYDAGAAAHDEGADREAPETYDDAEVEAWLKGWDDRYEAAPPNEDDEDTTAPAGETYLIIGEAYGEDGKRPTYQDGKPFSRVTEKGAGKLTAYDLHAPELPAAEATDDGPAGESSGPSTASPDSSEQSQQSTDSSAPAADDAPGPGEQAQTERTAELASGAGNAFEAFEDRLADADTWAAVKGELGALSQTPAWQDADEEAKRLARIAAYERYEDLLTSSTIEPVGLTADLQLFRCWIEVPTLTGPEIQKVWRDVIRSAAYGGLDEASKDGLGGAVAARKSAAG